MSARARQPDKGAHPQWDEAWIAEHIDLLSSVNARQWPLAANDRMAIAAMLRHLVRLQRQLVGHKRLGRPMDIDLWLRVIMVDKLRSEYVVTKEQAVELVARGRTGSDPAGALGKAYGRFRVSGLPKDWLPGLTMSPAEVDCAAAQFGLVRKGQKRT